MTPFIILTIFATFTFVLLVAAAAVMASRLSVFDPLPELLEEREDIEFEPMDPIRKPAKKAAKPDKKVAKKAVKKSKRKKK